jgi:hypothetical protein
MSKPRRQIKPQSYQLIIGDSEDGRTFIPLHEGLLEELGWKIGDDVELRNTKHGFRLVNLSFDER